MFVPGLHLEAVSGCAGCARGAHAEAANAHLAAHQGAGPKLQMGWATCLDPQKAAHVGELGGEKKKIGFLITIGISNCGKKLLLLTFDPYIPYDEIYLEYHADLMPKPSHTWCHTYILGFKEHAQQL